MPAGVEGFWGAIAAGDTLQRRVPLERWDVDAYYDPERGTLGMSYVRCGASHALIPRHHQNGLFACP